MDAVEEYFDFQMMVMAGIYPLPWVSATMSIGYIFYGSKAVMSQGMMVKAGEHCLRLSVLHDSA